MNEEITKQTAAVVALLEEDRSRRITKDGLKRVREAVYALELPPADAGILEAMLGYTPGLFEGLS